MHNDTTKHHPSSIGKVASTFWIHMDRRQAANLTGVPCVIDYLQVLRLTQLDLLLGTVL